jgi:D-alanyl-D-alanine endopeptidase (penicillin-binding protein 7)
MRFCISIVTVFFLCISLFPQHAAAQIDPTFSVNTESLKKILTTAEYAALRDIIVAAKSAYAYIPETDTVLFSKNEDSVVPLASIIKLMVAVTASDILLPTDNVEIKVGDTVPYGEYGLVLGEKFTFETARHMMLIVSSNDMAWAIARTAGEKLIKNNPALAGRTPQAVFLEKMNAKAQEINLPTISSKSITGLDFQNGTAATAFGSAHEIAQLVNYIVTNYPVIAASARQSSVTVFSNVKSHTYQNTNKYLGAIQDLMLSKTGYTQMAGGNLAISRRISNDASVIVVVLGSGREERFFDTLAINNAIARIFQ